MRKLLVKLFVLDYTFRLGKTRISGPRAGTIILPLFIITGLLAITNPQYPDPHPLLWLSYFLTAVSLFFGFIYFRLKPAKWEELGTNQKMQAGYFLKLTGEQYEEWTELRRKNDFNK